MLEKENKAPINYEDWIDSGRIIIPCMKGIPEVKKWSDTKFKISKEEWEKNYPHCEIALRLDQDIDLDVDNPLAKRFIPQYVNGCGAVSGRGANPWSHYWWKGEVEFTQFKLPG